MKEIESFEELYQETRPVVERYVTRILLNNRNLSAVSPEDLIQRVYAVAWQRHEDVLQYENPAGWLIECAKRVYMSVLREEQKWSANIELTEETANIRDFTDVQKQVELKLLLEDEDFHLLKRHYGDGVPYEVLCRELNIGKSALAMRIKRAKERFRKLWEEE